MVTTMATRPERVTLRLSKAELHELERRAIAERLTVSDAVRRGLGLAIVEHRTGPGPRPEAS